MSEGRGCEAGCRGCDEAALETGGPSPCCLVVIPLLPDFHACYLGVVREIGFVEWMIGLVREGGGDCRVRIGGPGESTSLVVNHGEDYVAA